MRSKVKKQAEEDANHLVRTATRESFGVEPFEIAERVGVKVGEPELDQDILGALFMKPGVDPRMVVNRRLSLLRWRFTCALELGHYVQMSVGTIEYKRVDLCDRSEERGGRSDDRYADEFAASLLMPKTDVELLNELRMGDLEMALRFFVPREVMQWRLRGQAPSTPEAPERFRYLEHEERAQKLFLGRLFAEQEHGLRQKYADWIIRMLGAQLLIADLIFLAFAWAGRNWDLSPGWSRSGWRRPWCRSWGSSPSSPGTSSRAGKGANRTLRSGWAGLSSARPGGRQGWWRWLAARPSEGRGVRP